MPFAAEEEWGPVCVCYHAPSSSVPQNRALTGGGMSSGSSTPQWGREPGNAFRRTAAADPTGHGAQTRLTRPPLPQAQPPRSHHGRKRRRNLTRDPTRDPTRRPT